MLLAPRELGSSRVAGCTCRDGVMPASPWPKSIRHTSDTRPGGVHSAEAEQH